MQTFEKLGVFYLGKVVDPRSGNLTQEYLLYNSNDLVTHAVCVGMTGSGKTGLCIALLEEAAIDNVPAIVIDPKGDLGNLLLSFPGLDAGEFRPWINEDEARTKSMSPDEYAANEAERWRRGLADWDQDPARIERLHASSQFAIYTPGSTAGIPVSIASSLAAPPKAYMGDRELLSQHISTTASGLLSLLGIDADPLRSREHILISRILEHEWTAGKNLDMSGLIRMIQSPPMERAGVFDLESFYPSAQRFELAMMLNNLLAAPGFGMWMEGENLDIGRMLHDETGKPRTSIFHIAHLSDAERMFFVTLLLNQTLGWMRSQSGTTTLRAILYMDEIFGYFPPVSEPPSKRPLLTLLKQARAYGLGVVLATQNPVDLDYKGLANAGTWFVGRLQTERDRERLVDGLLGSGTSAGAALDRQQALSLIANLKPRTFLMQNAHEDHPVTFATRWALSYLAGPLTREQIRLLGEGSKTETDVAPAAASAPPAKPAPQPATEAVQDAPSLPSDIRQFFAPSAGTEAGPLTYQPFLYASAKVQIVNNKIGFTSSRIVAHALVLQPNMTAAAWDEAAPVEPAELRQQPDAGASYVPVPTTLLQGGRLAKCEKGYLDYVQRKSEQAIWKSAVFKATSQAGESERDFRVRLQQLARERRDFELEKLRRRYSSKFATLRQRLQRAQQRLEREQESYGQQKMQTAISVGATLLSAFMGRKAISTGTLGRATTAARQAGRIAREKQDVLQASDEKATVEQQLTELEQQLTQEADQMAKAFDPQSETLQQIVFRPAKSDILLQDFGILWMPV